MVAVLVDLETTLIKKITQVSLDEMFIERLVMGWNPYRHAGDQYNKSYDDEAFAKRIQEIYNHDTSRELWMKSW